MHVPDGFFDTPVCVATGAVAVAAVVGAARGSRRELDERQIPLAGLVAAFVFAVQMVNFPIGGGTSGHLMGGALAAILVGPYTAVLCLSVVLTAQALLFADGGLSALGVNVTLLGVVAVVAAYPLFRALLRALPAGRRSAVGATFVAALVSVPVAAVVFTLLYAVGGTADVPLGEVFAAMVGVHTAIGVGEAAITALTVAVVLSVRPDLVHGVRDRATASGPRRTVPGSGAPVRPEAPRDPEPVAVGSVAAPHGGGAVWGVGLAVTVACAGVVSHYASSELDGLERVSADHGILEQEREHALAGSPLADYTLQDVGPERLAGGLAGILGVGTTLATGTGLALLVRRRGTDGADDPGPAVARQSAAPVEPHPGDAR